MQKHKQSGFTLVELMIVIAVIAIITGVALPGFLSSRKSANESAAISTMRSIASAQAQVQVNNAIDSDADGAGEFGYLGELSGFAPTRISVGGVPVLGGVGDELDPTIVSAGLGNVQPDALGDGVVTRSGYVFKLFLPGAVAGGVIPGLPEDAAGGAVNGSFPDPTAGETFWACYAWPVDANRTGNRTFFMNQDNELIFTANRNGDYSGLVTPASIPNFDAAFSNETGGADLSAPLAVNGALSNDANLWSPVQ